MLSLFVVMSVLLPIRCLCSYGGFSCGVGSRCCAAVAVLFLFVLFLGVLCCFWCGVGVVTLGSVAVYVLLAF